MSTLIFIHIPKTGGTSLIQSVKKNFSKNEIFNTSETSLQLFGNQWRQIPFEERQRKIEQFFSNKTNKERNDYKLIIGHMNYGWHQYIDNYQYLTFLRDPVERVLSLYRYIIEYRPELVELYSKNNRFELSDFIQSGHSEISNGISKRLTLSTNQDLQYQDIMKNLNTFAFVGITEMMDKSYFLMNKQFSLKIRKLKHSNQTNKSKYSFTKNDIERIKSLNEIDIKIYSKYFNKLEQQKVKKTIFPFIHSFTK